MKILILHGYSNENRGDGLLVRETLSLVREVARRDAIITLVSSYPESFANLEDVHHVSSMPKSLPEAAGYLRTLLRVRSFDLVVGVGGGYLRGKTLMEALKTAIVHGPQLLAGALAGSRCVYLPQSIGPFKYLRWPVQRLLRRISAVWVRDDRSLGEQAQTGARRGSDLAVLAMRREGKPFASDAPFVLTVRSVHGVLPPDVKELRARLGPVESFIQSQVGSNNDYDATVEISPDRIVASSELMEASESRVVVAVRLHAALMALQAGHYVIHLSYERKGFGAFADLNLADYVFNVNDFDTDHVTSIAQELKDSPAQRKAYDLRVRSAQNAIRDSGAEVIRSLENVVSGMSAKSACYSWRKRPRSDA